MPRQKAINYFTGKMDRDTDPALLKEGDYIDALGLLPGVSGMQQSLGNFLGNVAVDMNFIEFPEGTNTVIGSVEDKQTEALYWFMHNSDSGLGYIFKYVDLQDETKEVMLVAVTTLFNWAPQNRIHGTIVDGKYLYFSDGRAVRDNETAESELTGNPPCKINTQKAIRSNNLMECIIIPVQARESADIDIFKNGNTYTFTIYTPEGAPLEEMELTADGTFLNDPAGGLNWIKEQIEGNTDFSPYIQVDDCDGCKLSIVSLSFGLQLKLTTSNGEVILVPTGYYPDELEVQHFQLLRQPPVCPPLVSFTKDTTTAINTVQRKGFQFRVRYIYDDGERSAWGPISLVALNLGVNGETVDDLNAIEINFSDDRLGDPDWLCIIKQVEIAVRDGNDGIWKSIKTMERCDLGISSQVYVWTNDQEYAAVPSDDTSQGSSDLQVLKLYDELPLITAAITSAAGTEGDQRLFLADNLEGYDCPDCVTVDFTVEEYQNTGLIDIIGTVRVLDGPGGSPVDPNYGDTYIIDGFPVYLAGTDYFGVSENPADGSGDGSFIIKGVPRGIYILRVASYKCRFDDSLGSRHNINNGREWQRTSSPVLSCANGTNDTERVIDLSSFSGTLFDLDAEIGFGTIDIQDGYATDDSIQCIEIYVLDNGGDLTSTGSSAPTEENIGLVKDEIMGGIGVERQRVLFGDGVGGSDTMYTDHNGYTFFLAEANGGYDMLLNSFDDYLAWQTDQYSWKYIEDGTIVAGVGHVQSDGSGGVTAVFGVFTNSDFTTTIFFINRDAAYTAASRRTLSGLVVDNEGKGLPGVLVMYERNGRQELTDSFGAFAISIYAPNGGSPGARTDDNVYITYPNDINYDFPPTPPSDLPSISPWDNYVVPTFSFGFSGGLVVDGRFLKNGAQYKAGILYEDDGNRTCGVIPLDTIRIPFCTEDGSVIKHQVRWQISSQPPEWATHYRFVRTKNLVHYRYFQWVTDEVKFGVIGNPAAAPTFSDFSAGNWNYIFIRVNSKDVEGIDAALLLFFQEQKEGYTPLVGDRVRFMLNESSSPVTSGKILELDVAGRYIDGDNFYVVIPRVEFNGGLEPQAGWSFEFYTPKGVEEPFYYETTDCYEILDHGTNDRRHSGPMNDQVLDTTPAEGLLMGGDTYWRFKAFDTVGDGVRFNTENTTISPYHTAACEDIGRALVESDGGQKWRYNRVRYSGLFIPQSETNGLASFGALDYLDINRQFGPIVKLEYAGGVLLALAWHKAQSFYLKKGQVLDLQGGQTVGRSDRVIDYADEFRADAGCQHPESVATEHGRVYWWDAYRGRVWRYSQAGVEAIDAGLYSTFQAISKERKNLPASTNLVVGGYDHTSGLYLLSFPAATYNDGDNSVTAETYAFSEIQDGWKTRMPFIPDCYGAIGNALFSFYQGLPYKHYEGDYGVFYADQYQSTIKYAVNQLPASVKDWYCMSIRTDGQWQATFIEVPANLNYKSGMLSRLKLNWWNTYEGDWCADFLRDMNDTSGEFLAIIDDAVRARTALLKGRPLKGHVLIVTLESNVDAEAIKIWHVVTEFSESMKTGL